MKFTKIPLDTFKNIQLNAGVMLKDFDPASVPDDETLFSNLLWATSGGISVSATPSFSDLGDDIDNCPKNTKELKHLDSWEATMGGTAVTITKDSARICFAAADVDEESGKITLRNDLDSDSDFMSLWWVGDYNNGKGFVAVHMKNALSTGGFSIKTTDQGKTTADFEFTGHYSITAQDDVPFECYICEDMGADGDDGTDDADGTDGTDDADGTDGTDDAESADGSGGDDDGGSDGGDDGTEGDDA